MASLTDGDKASIARTQVPIQVGFGRWIHAECVDTGARYQTRGPKLWVPYPALYAVGATWKDRGGWHFFHTQKRTVRAYVEVVTDEDTRATFLVVDGAGWLANPWPEGTDLYLKPPLHETVSWWRW